MRQKSRPPAARQTLCGLFLILAGSLASGAGADEPTLVVHLTGGESADYSMSGIERLEFQTYYEVDELVVVLADEEDVYPLDTIRRVEFLWDVSSTGDPREAAGLIDALHLFQSRPNPFSTETRIGFDLPRAGEIDLSIYAPDGRLVRTLVAGECPAGRQSVRWDGLDDAGRPVAGGVYFYTLNAPGIEESRQMILLP
ncbi:MAG: hypothetical protein GF355_15615 [Candidatus Eisenbacteria bacterium]|nr:hypothetical protein [Candidatus Eisenbacteria bacterium]